MFIYYLSIFNLLFFAFHHFLKIFRNRSDYFQCLVAEHIKKFVFIRMEELPLDIQLFK